MISLICYNLKATNIYIFSFNQNQNIVNTPFIIFKRYRNKKNGKTSTDIFSVVKDNIKGVTQNEV